MDIAKGWARRELGPFWPRGEGWGSREVLSWKPGPFPYAGLVWPWQLVPPSVRRFSSQDVHPT